MMMVHHDELFCKVNVEHLRQSKSKPDRGIVSHRCELINQKGQKVFEVVSTAMVRCRPE